MNEPFLKRILNKPPLLFPWVALFHAAMFLYLVVSYIGEPLSGLWLQPLWMLGYTIAWLFSCDLKRWAAFMYIGLTSLNIILRLVVKDATMLNMLTDTLFPFDILFSFFLFFYFKKFE